MNEMVTFDEQVSMLLMFMFVGVVVTVEGVNFFVSIVAAGVAGFLTAVGVRLVKIGKWHLEEWLGLHK